MSRLNNSSPTLTHKSTQSESSLAQSSCTEMLSGGSAGTLTLGGLRLPPVAMASFRFHTLDTNFKRSISSRVKVSNVQSLLGKTSFFFFPWKPNEPAWRARGVCTLLPPLSPANLTVRYHKCLFPFLSLPHLFSKHRYLDKCKIVMCLLFFPLTLHMYFSIEIKLFSVFPLLLPFHSGINLFPTTTEIRKSYICLSILPQILH